jgi:hypothetical protein
MRRVPYPMVGMDIENEIDALFALPLADFTGARNALAARLKKEGRVNDAERVKSLQKPPVSAWAVNQLYWRHREAFDRLLATGEQFRKAQTSRLSGKEADLAQSRSARRESLNQLSGLAAELLQEGGHNASPETLRRVGTTLEAISAYAALPAGFHPGRLTEDTDPPGFDALTALISDVPKTRQQKNAAGETRIAEAKAALREAEQAVKRARVIAEETNAARKNAAAVKKEAEKLMREADERLKAATTEADAAARALLEAEQAMRDASSKLQSLLQGTMRSSS